MVFAKVIPIRCLWLSFILHTISVEGDASSQVGRHKISTLCESTAVVVKSVVLTCDSPGEYYYGSRSYRKSETCRYGDKVNLNIYLTINIQNISSHGGIKISIDMGVYDVLKRVQERINICKCGTISSETSSSGNSVTCPDAGDYQLSNSFQLPDLFEDHDIQYTPDIRAKFFSGDGNRTILGCASTGTIDQYRNGSTHSQNGQVAFGAAIIVFAGSFGCLLYLTYRRKKRLEQERAQMTLIESHYGYVRSSKSGHVMRMDENGQLQP